MSTARPSSDVAVNAGFATSLDQRYFEDYVAGSVHELGEVCLSEAEIIAFARRYDPQPMHVDPDAARRGAFGGLIASGWHTVGAMMRLCVEQYLSAVASIASPGIDELRWLQPVRPGDRLSVRATVLDAKRSKSKPDRGLVTTAFEVRNQRGELVMTLRALNLLSCRPSS